MVSPLMGVQSILKSPVWTMVPPGVLMANATESGMEWLTWMNLISMQPSRMVLPALTTLSFTLLTRLCSRSLFSTKPSVSGVP